MKNIFLSILLLSLTIVAYTQEERKVIREGNKYYNTKDYDKSALNYKKAYKINPESHNLLNNIGASQYRNGMFTESAVNYENFLKMTGSKKEKAD
ncbi:MAG: tetratricopeptide repeat protein, partial [Bacteroidales bacterium]|nr:tetratricopeptide repeat protein [Bacteroidales bacterium]